ncbi:MAG: response regulator [Chitinophagaceae bacterium]|nr:response regulator [Rubrivivax sp.]
MPSSVHLYFVDFDDSMRTSFSRLMRASGIKATMYRTPEQFLSDTGHDAVGCVVLDFPVDEAISPQLQTRFQQSGPNLPMIGVSARDNDGMRESARALGARFFLRKPVDDKALLDAIFWVLEQHPECPAP